MAEDELQALLAQACELTPDERVTRFLSRDITLPHTDRTAEPSRWATRWPAPGCG
jgi:hypothetical protein